MAKSEVEQILGIFEDIFAIKARIKQLEDENEKLRTELAAAQNLQPQQLSPQTSFEEEVLKRLDTLDRRYNQIVSRLEEIYEEERYG
jgi:regulator of replication initiation timing